MTYDQQQKPVFVCLSLRGGPCVLFFTVEGNPDWKGSVEKGSKLSVRTKTSEMALCLHSINTVYAEWKFQFLTYNSMQWKEDLVYKKCTFHSLFMLTEPVHSVCWESIPANYSFKKGVTPFSELLKYKKGVTPFDENSDDLVITKVNIFVELIARKSFQHFILML